MSEVRSEAGRIWRITLDRPSARNAISRAMLEEMRTALADAAPLSIRASKRGIRSVLRKLSIDRESEGYRVADFDLMAADALASDDLREGLDARRGRRPPEFRGT